MLFVEYVFCWLLGTSNLPSYKVATLKPMELYNSKSTSATAFGGVLLLTISLAVA